MMASTEGSLDIRPFEAAVSDEALGELKQLLRLARIGPATLENTTHADPSYGVSRSWVQDAREYWLNEYDWYCMMSIFDPLRSEPLLTALSQAQD